MELSGKDSANVANGDVCAIDETALVARARQADDLAWERLVRQHQQAVFRLAYLILGDMATRSEAEDVAQEAFIRAYLKLDQFDAARPLQPWLLGIAANLARNRRRSVGRYWAALRRWLQAHPDPDVTTVNLDERTEARLLWQAVQKLRSRAREVVYLRYFLELSEAETAATLDIPAGTVKSRLYYGLRALRLKLEEMGVVG
jgi:RNA polymerase sigma-70 factor (ECF subfamily)